MKALSILTILCFAFCHKKEDDKVKEVEILKVSFSTETIIGISCEKFLLQFGARVYTYHISDRNVVKRITRNISNSIPFEGCDVDVRAKMYIHYESGRIDTLCFDNFECFVKNKQTRLLQHRDLIKFLDSLGGY